MSLSIDVNLVLIGFFLLALGGIGHDVGNGILLQHHYRRAQEAFEA
ncbi:MAG: hypothetical protein IT331_23720 [Anaerolineae bacterium]|nr:hypothetical protein [Anaerolineae bacterium]